MRREERVTVQGPVKEQQRDGMSHRGGGGGRAFRGVERAGTPTGGLTNAQGQLQGKWRRDEIPPSLQVIGCEEGPRCLRRVAPHSRVNPNYLRTELISVTRGCCTAPKNNLIFSFMPSAKKGSKDWENRIIFHYVRVLPQNFTKLKFKMLWKLRIPQIMRIRPVSRQNGSCSGAML